MVTWKVLENHCQMTQTIATVPLRYLEGTKSASVKRHSLQKVPMDHMEGTVSATFKLNRLPKVSVVTWKAQ